MRMTGPDGTRLFRMPFSGSPVESIPLAGDVRLVSGGVPLGPTAATKDGRLLIQAAAGSMWAWPAPRSACCATRGRRSGASRRAQSPCVPNAPWHRLAYGTPWPGYCGRTPRPPSPKGFLNSSHPVRFRTAGVAPNVHLPNTKATKGRFRPKRCHRSSSARRNMRVRNGLGPQSAGSSDVTGPSRRLLASQRKKAARPVRVGRHLD